MKALTGVLRKLDDWCNPIAVKELRQAVQGRFIAGLLLLFLLGQLVTMAAILLTRDEYGYEYEAGRDVFLILFAILIGTCLLFLPAYTAVRLIIERSRANVDLYFVTALRPRTIVWGKFLSGLVLAVVIFSAFMPFLTFTYLLRGIDLGVIFFMLVYGFIATAFAIQLAGFLACIPATRLLRALLGLVGLGIIGWMTLNILRMAYVVLMWGMEFSGDLRRLLGALIVTLVVVLTAMGYLFVWSVALLSPPSANRALPVRLYMFITWLITGAGAFIWGLAEHDTSPVEAWLVLAVIMFCVALLTAVSEREAQGPRVARRIPRSRWLRVFAFLFYSGAAGGVLWACLMICLSLLVLPLFNAITLLRFRSTTHVADIVSGSAGLALYVFCYAMTASLIRRGLFRKATQGHTWIIAVFLAGIAFLVSVLRFILHADPWAYREVWNLANPTLVFSGNEETRSLAFTFVSVWAGIVTLLSLPWFHRQVRSFRPHGGAPGPQSPALSHG